MPHVIQTTQQPQIIWMIIGSISVNMINLQLLIQIHAFDGMHHKTMNMKILSLSIFVETDVFITVIFSSRVHERIHVVTKDFTIVTY